jgi:6-phosphogluconolactonase (cycloisomerase 2 family)
LEKTIMKHVIARLALVAGLVSGIGLVATQAVAGAVPVHRGAAFVLTDAPTNSVIAYSRAVDGTLTPAGTYATGGAGLSAVGAAADPIASQGGLALAQGDHELLAVNSGSNSVSVFHVDGAQLTLTDQVSSGGSFPVSIATFGSLVAVLNAGSQGSVAEFALVGGHLVALPGQVRSLGLNNTSPPFFVNGPGQVGYSPNGHFLIVTTKSSSNSFEVFGVSPFGRLSDTAAVTPSATPVPFAFSFDRQGDIVAVEAAKSTLSVYSINHDGSLTTIGSVGDGQAALCWVTEARGIFYGSNAGSASVSSFTVAPNGSPSLVNATAGSAFPGTIDSAASPDGRYLYVESGGSGKLSVFATNPSGILTSLQVVTGLPVPYEGIAVS